MSTVRRISPTAFPGRGWLPLATLLLILALAVSACAPAPPAPATGSGASQEPSQAEAQQPTQEEAAPAAQEEASMPAPSRRPEVVYDLPNLGGRVVQAVTGNDYTPLNFVDPKTGEAVGWEYDAVEEICRRLNCVVSWNVTSWEAMIPAVANGQFDVGMDGITITEERAQQVDFSAPYMTSQQFMLVRADEERFSTPEEFAANPELLIGAQPGTTGFYTAVYEILDGDEANPRIKLFESFGAAVQALIAGDVDMVLVDAASGRGYIGANPDALKIVGDALATEEFGFIFTPGSDLVEPFNAAIETILKDGYAEYLNTKWFFLYSPN